MERLLNPEERIRRAEEIYARRQSLRDRTKKATVNVNGGKKNLKLFKKLVLQIVICILMYFIFYLINTTNYSFSEITLSKTNELISYDFNFMSIYNAIVDNINNYILNNKKDNEDKDSNQTNEASENAINVEQNEAGVGSAEQAKVDGETDTNILGLEAKVDEETTEEQDTTNVEESTTDKIKKEYSFILPVKRNCYFRIWDKRSYIKYSIYISQGY